jgi:hypothetical protein
MDSYKLANRLCESTAFCTPGDVSNGLTWKTALLSAPGGNTNSCAVNAKTAGPIGVGPKPGTSKTAFGSTNFVTTVRSPSMIPPMRARALVPMPRSERARMPASSTWNVSWPAGHVAAWNWAAVGFWDSAQEALNCKKDRAATSLLQTPHQTE